MKQATQTDVPLGATVQGETFGVGRFEHLSIVWAILPDGKAVCWIRNLQTDGFLHGIYGDEARESYLARCRHYCGA